MRVILYTGKGGVGKTSVAAATALRSSQLGHRTIVLSTDPAHSLADSFDVPLGGDPRLIAPNLWGQEVSILQEVRNHWGIIQDWVAELLAWRGLDEIVAEELAVLPGMEELASLLYVTTYHDKSEYEVLVIDCAPTGETLRLLAFPEVARWWMERIFPIERKAATLLRPFVKPILNIPIPDDQVFKSISELFAQINRMRAILTDPETTSVRLVVNPEKMVIKESQRTLTYLNLYGYATDLLICNRLIPDQVSDPYFQSWKESQIKYYQFIEENFSPLPIRNAPLLNREVVGIDMLEIMAVALFGEDDPTQVFFKGTIQGIEKEDGQFVLVLRLPFVSKEEVSLMRSGNELTVQVGNFRRNVILPQVLAGLATREARFVEGNLRIEFEEKGV
ncbi:MAG: ArsA family ATPase [Chloroflexi bacterium]|nr:ArsA family ATPase [Chloroflexota bacterium]